jgi:peptide chain release factor
VADTEQSRIKGNIRSCLLAVEGENADGFVASWTGTVQWIWQSAYRPHHKRKNWFVAVQPVAPASPQPAQDKAIFSTDDVRFETARSGLRHNHYELERGNPVRIFEE